MIKVIDFDWASFESFVVREVAPNIQGSIVIIGIANGGLPLAERVHELLSRLNFSTLEYTQLTCQRPSTRSKKKSRVRIWLLTTLFKLAPRRLVDWLRTLEHNRLSQRRGGDLERDIRFINNTPTHEADCILLVDDAIDSGASLQQIREYLTIHEQVDEAKIRALVAAVTQDRPLVEPDYAWSRGSLVRFPWSLDAR